VSIERAAIIDKCEGCNHTDTSGESTYCSAYALPSWKWELGQCNLATHIKREAKKAAFINPLKAAKMRARGLH
jgi:hypothetical protein